MLNYVKKSDAQEFIVATEAGILHELRRNCPEKVFIPVPPEQSGSEAENGSEGTVPSSCHCNECQYMKMNTLRKIYNALKYEWPEVTVEEEIAKDAVKPIERMLKLSN